MSDAYRDWQPIETAPKDGTMILGVRVFSYPGGERFVSGATMMWEGGGGRVLSGGWAYSGFLVCMVEPDHMPTHWMPLPAPPADHPEATV